MKLKILLLIGFFIFTDGSYAYAKKSDVQKSEHISLAKKIAQCGGLYKFSEVLFEKLGEPATAKSISQNKNGAMLASLLLVKPYYSDASSFINGQMDVEITKLSSIFETQKLPSAMKTLEERVSQCSKYANLTEKILDEYRGHAYK